MSYVTIGIVRNVLELSNIKLWMTTITTSRQTGHLIPSSIFYNFPIIKKVIKFTYCRSRSHPIHSTWQEQYSFVPSQWSTGCALYSFPTPDHVLFSIYKAKGWFIFSSFCRLLCLSAVWYGLWMLLFDRTGLTREQLIDGFSLH